LVASAHTLQAPRFRGKSYLALVLQPAAPFEAWLESLAELSRRSPGFFTSRPVVLDIADLRLTDRDLLTLVSALERFGIRVMGFEGAQNAALAPGLPPVLRGGRLTGDVSPANPKQEAPPPPAAPPSSVTVENVRSGQSIFADGDVTVCGSVASGAEVVAGGSIHVYGTLRGRAIAGAQGNAGARIFCRKLEAEFLAVDTCYLTAEAIDPALAGKAVQIRSDHDTLKLDILR
jgi:septum site-determining protein MinC